MEQLSPEQLMAEAVAATGFSDFGADGFREGLERNAAAAATLPITPQARAALRAKLVLDLSTRLRVEAWIAAHPQCQSKPVETPVLVCGLPRTGTTATVAMLALDERFRFLRAWEGGDPIPPPIAGEETSDPRAPKGWGEGWRGAGTSAAMHLSDPNGPEEDLALLAGLDMRNFHGVYPMPDDYMDWWVNDSFASTYAYHERVLRLLHSSRPPQQWLLKAPPHIFKLEAFAAQYPDTKFVMTHRDPAKLVPSVASLYHHLYASRCEPGAVEKAWTGARCLSFWAEGVRRGLAARARIGEHRFIDVWNRDVVKDPIGTFEKLYDALGYPLDATLRAQLEAYHRKNARGSFGEHAYTAEEYGLSDAAIRSAFGDYVERFAL